MASYNRVLKTLCFAIEMRRFLMKFTGNHLISIAKHSVFRTWIQLCSIFSFPFGKVKKMESENRALETLCFISKIQWFLMNFMKNRLGFIVRISISRTRFSLFRIHTWCHGILMILEVKNSWIYASRTYTWCNGILMIPEVKISVLKTLLL